MLKWKALDNVSNSPFLVGLEAESKLELVLMVVEDAEVSSPEPELPAHDVSFITENYYKEFSKVFNIQCHK